MKTMIRARQLGGVLGEEIISQTQNIIDLGLRIYRRFKDEFKEKKLEDFSEAKDNFIKNGSWTASRTLNAYRLIDNERQWIYKDGD